MALKKCRECQREVSSKAKACPGCGAPVRVEIGLGKGCLLVVVFVFVVGMISAAFSPGHNESQKASPRQATPPKPLLSADVRETLFILKEGIVPRTGPS